MSTVYRSAVTYTEVPYNKEMVQEVGKGVLLYRSGKCRLGRYTFGYGEPIDDVEFEKGCFAARRFDDETHLYIKEGGRLRAFHEKVLLYSWWERKWYEENPLQDKKYVADLNKHGAFGANVRHSLRNLTHALWVSVFGYLGLFFWLGVFYVGAVVLFYAAAIVLTGLVVIFSQVFGG